MARFTAAATTAVPAAAPKLVFLLVAAAALLGFVWGDVDADQYHQYHLFHDSFPRNDEYNLMALDPNTPYGTPYGGFSRATASRLASLPLRLPSITEQADSSSSSSNNDDSNNYDNNNDSKDDEASLEPIYATVRDHFGREYACRFYHEDELEEDSLGGSMFDTPKPRKKTENNPVGEATGSSPSASSLMKENGLPAPASEDIPHPSDQKGNDALSPSPLSAAEDTRRLSEMGLDPILLGHTVHQRLSKLTGLCAQFHPNDWWSYEWCHQEGVKQFHVSMQSSQDGKAAQFKIEEITSLGGFSSRNIDIVHGAKNNKENKKDNLAGNRKELARIYDTFVGGDTCQATGKPRVTEVVFRCCSEKTTAKIRGGVLKHGNQIDTDVVFFYEATESERAVCHYNVTLCTPLLCDDYDDGSTAKEGSGDDNNNKPSDLSSLKNMIDKSTVRDARKKKDSQLNLDLDPAEIENMSVKEVLDKTFGTSGNFCMRSQTGGWWTYQFCVGDHVRQFHQDEISLVEEITGRFGQKKKGDSGFILGRYVPEDHIGVTKENEWEHVVNATASLEFAKNNNNNKATPGSNNKAASTSAGGNGAYYVQEYTKGDVCDHEDVTDSAVKAGEFGEGGIERAITVRYSCNSDLSIQVREDSTCHYAVDVGVPTLCHHPLFRAPVTKKRVVKCLPI